MKICVYQIVPELDHKEVLFRDLAHVKKAGDGRIPSEIYGCIYSGELPVKDPEDVFVMCNREHPEGYRGHSLSVSDVVEFRYETGESRFFFCDPWGFPVVDFDVSRAISYPQDDSEKQNITQERNVQNKTIGGKQDE